MKEYEDGFGIEDKGTYFFSKNCLQNFTKPNPLPPPQLRIEKIKDNKN